MANYFSTSRSNYFRVKDEEALERGRPLGGPDCWIRGGSAEESSDTHFALAANEGGWPTDRWDEEANDYLDSAVYDEIAEHLVPGDVAIFMEVGNEKLRYLCGQAIAVNAEGEQRSVDLVGIYDIASKDGNNVTRAEY